jgi:hypothetical protein
MHAFRDRPIALAQSGRRTSRRRNVSTASRRDPRRPIRRGAQVPASQCRGHQCRRHLAPASPGARRVPGGPTPSERRRRFTIARGVARLAGWRQAAGRRCPTADGCGTPFVFAVGRGCQGLSGRHGQQAENATTAELFYWHAARRRAVHLSEFSKLVRRRRYGFRVSKAGVWWPWKARSSIPTRSSGCRRRRR